MYALGVVVWEMMTRRVPGCSATSPAPRWWTPSCEGASDCRCPRNRPEARRRARARGRPDGTDRARRRSRTPSEPRGGGGGRKGAFAAAAPIADARGREVVAALGEARAEDEERGDLPEADAASDAFAWRGEAEAGRRDRHRGLPEKKRLLPTREGVGSSDGRRRATSNGATERRPRTTTRSKPPRGSGTSAASRRVDRARIPRVGSAPRARTTRRRSPRTSPRRFTRTSPPPRRTRRRGRRRSRRSARSARRWSARRRS